jgi:hypothetical protein
VCVYGLCAPDRPDSGGALRLDTRSPGCGQAQQARDRSKDVKQIDGSCRESERAILGRRRRRCRVYIAAVYWLHQPDHHFLLAHLAHLAGELGLPAPTTQCASDPQPPCEDKTLLVVEGASCPTG